MTPGREPDEDRTTTWDLLTVRVGGPEAALVDAVIDAHRATFAAGGIEVEVDRHLHLFKTHYEHRLRMILARAAGISYPMAMERWGDADALAAEVAWEAWLQADKRGRHPPCGVRPDEVLDMDDPGMRPLDNPAVKIQKTGCYVCKTLAEARETLTEEERKAGVDFFVVPASPGDDFVEY